jgi:hypothetical protein
MKVRAKAISFDDDDSHWRRREVKPRTDFGSLIVKAILVLLFATAGWIIGAVAFLVIGGLLNPQ